MGISDIHFRLDHRVRSTKPGRGAFKGAIGQLAFLVTEPQLKFERTQQVQWRVVKVEADADGGWNLGCGEKSYSFEGNLCTLPDARRRRRRRRRRRLIWRVKCVGLTDTQLQRRVGKANALRRPPSPPCAGAANSHFSRKM